MLRDSVFDPVLYQFASQEEEASAVSVSRTVPYLDDEPIQGRKAITDAFDKTEDKFSNLLTAAAWSETDRYLKKIDKAKGNS